MPSGRPCILFEPFQPPVSGREHIASKIKAALATIQVHDLSFESQDVYHDRVWLVDFGTVSETFSLEGREERNVVEGNYTALLERNADGDWKVKRFMPLPSNSLPPE